MKHERTLQEQTRQIDEIKADRPILTEKGARQPEGVRDTNFLFDGETFSIRHKGQWVAIGKINPLNEDAIQEQIDEHIPFSTQL